jgi:hypothetical protein
LDIVLGMSMAPSSIQMVLVEGENADGATVEEDEIAVTAADDLATEASGQAIAAILGTREGATEAGLRLSSIGVAWTDQLEAHALRDALAAHKVQNVMLVSAFLAAAALTQSVGAATGSERTAVLFVEPDSATLAVVETADGSISDIRASRRTAIADLVNMVVGLEKLGSAVGGVFVIGSGVDVAPLKPHLEAATSLAVNVPEEPGTALARGAALASANAPLFVSSTAALAYSLDPGTGAVGPSAVPEYLRFPDVSPDASLGEELAYSAVPDEDADTPTVVIGTVADADGRRSRRKPVLLLGSGVAVVAIAAVVALEIATAVGIRRDVIALQPAPDQNLIVPTQQAPAPTPAEVPAAQPKVELPAPVSTPKPLNPAVAPAAPAPAPAAPAPAAPAPVAPVPAAPIPAPAAPAPAPPVVPVPVVVPVPIPPLFAPRPEPAARPPVVQIPAPQSPPRPATPPRGGVPGSPPQIGGPNPQPPVRENPPGRDSPPKAVTPGGGKSPGSPGSWPGGPGDGGGAKAPAPSGPFGGGLGPFGGGGRGDGGGPKAPAPAPSGPFGGGLGPFGGGGGGSGRGGGGPINVPAPAPRSPFGGGGSGGGSGGGGFGGGGFGGGPIGGGGHGGFGGGGLGGGGGHR